MKQLIFLILVMSFTFNALSQSKKKIRKHQIQNKEVWFTDYDTGDKSYKKSEKTFNANGDILVEKKFDIQGQLSEKRSYKYDEEFRTIQKTVKNIKQKKYYTFKYKYDENGDLASEKKFDKNMKLKSSISYKYKNGLLIKEQRYNSKKKLVKTIEYTFNGQLKTSKTTIDGYGKIIDKIEYKYTFTQ